MNSTTAPAYAKFYGCVSAIIESTYFEDEEKLKYIAEAIAEIEKEMEVAQ